MNNKDLQDSDDIDETEQLIEFAQYILDKKGIDPLN